MSAILSADDLNDFISPGVACIKPVETLPLKNLAENEYEVTTEDKVAAEQVPAPISLTDCLACSGCVTSAEAVLVSLQSHSEVLSALDSAPSVLLERLRNAPNGYASNVSAQVRLDDGVSEKLFVASISPQVRASIATTYGTTEKEAGWMIEQLLCGSQGISTGGKYGNRFTLVVDTNAMRDVCLVMEAERVKLSTNSSNQETPTIRKPILTSACPGWICYAEKKEPHVIPYLSPLKSPQALSGVLLKTFLSKKLSMSPRNIWHLAVMPCFDKKLEAARQELTDAHWGSLGNDSEPMEPVRDVDCVITAREILMLAESRGISFPSLPHRALPQAERVVMPDYEIETFLSKRRANHYGSNQDDIQPGTSGGFLHHILCTYRTAHPGSQIRSERGRNPDIVDYSVIRGDEVLFRAARYYGFRNIQNLVRKLRPAKISRMPGAKLSLARKAAQETGDIENAYVEVMACPGGCTNGGGQIKIDDLGELQSTNKTLNTPKEWLAAVDETYYSMEDSGDESGNHADRVDTSADDLVNGISASEIHRFLSHWACITGIDQDRLLYTSFREVESDVGKVTGTDTQHVVELASKIGGGW